jgi:hypothetical protein
MSIRTAGGSKGFTIDFGMPPDFVKVDGDSHFGRPVCV